MDDDESTQATQTVLDPRRLGKQNSGFSDEDISDIICVLYPHSDSARQEVQRLIGAGCPHIVGKDAVDGVEPDYEREDEASRFDCNPTGHGCHAIILRLSAQMKDPAAGFTFGRNSSRCDIVFVNDPLRRVSNIHFRIYVNEYGTVMIEDQSTNGTFVDRHLLTCQPRDASNRPVNKWVLSSGSVVKVFLHAQIRDLTFRVRIPRRDEDYGRVYLAKVDQFFAKHRLRPALEQQQQKQQLPLSPAALHPTNQLDLFKTPGEPLSRQAGGGPEALVSAVRREWNGSGKYNKIGTIGKGAFAVVFKVTSKFDGKPYAAKELEKRRFVKNGILDQRVDNEMKIMQRVQHPNIVRYMENFEWDDRLLIIIMEYVPGGDLGKLIAYGGPLLEEVAQVMSKQLLGALDYLHASNIIHRDVKPDNILINSLAPFEVKLTDFGLSKVIDSENTFLRTFCGTLLYCAPEVYTEFSEYDDDGVRSRPRKTRRPLGQRYSHAVDIWSLGGVLFYSLTGSPPYPVQSGISYSEILHMIMTTMLNTEPLHQRGVSEAGIDFLSLMLQRRPEKRASIAQLEGHPWLSPLQPEVEASQLCQLVDSSDSIAADSASSSRCRPVEHDDDRISDSCGEESSGLENGGGSPPAAPLPRLFGEVGISALASSGAIPSEYMLEMLVGDVNAGISRVGSIRSAQDGATDWNPSLASDMQSETNRRAHRQNGSSLYSDALQNLIDDVASQSLDGRDEAVPRKAASSDEASISLLMDPNSSKRKPQAMEAVAELEAEVLPPLPTAKRLKSDKSMDVGLADDESSEVKLLASVPQLKRLDSGRQIDSPVSKMIFWEPDRSTWHLCYPEMTQLQHDAFSQAALSRGEEFAPGRTPLWDLAMKHFPPSSETGADGPSEGEEVGAEIPSTATAALLDRPLDPSGGAKDAGSRQIVVPLQAGTSPDRAMAMMESDAGSCIDGISIPIVDSLTSFGRGPDNTDIFPLRQEPRVPKYGFKLMLWADGYDPSRTTSRPWILDSAAVDEASFSFWISTKATLGIRVNGQALASSEAKDPSGPSRHWAKLMDGDVVTLWGGPEGGPQTRLVFRCFWSASTQRRPSTSPALELADRSLASRLDAACLRTERRIRDTADKELRMGRARAEHLRRLQLVDRERERSRLFEERRRQALDQLDSLPLSPRRRTLSRTSGSTTPRPPSRQSSWPATTTTSLDQAVSHPGL